jgi:DnaJ-class molecular chaperone
MLGIEESDKDAVSSSDIRLAYRKAAKQLHPDTAAHKTEAERQAAAKRFLKLQKAYDVLKDARKRKLYNSGTPPDDSP